jgi:hypothetical protein
MKPIVTPSVSCSMRGSSHSLSTSRIAKAGTPEQQMKFSMTSKFAEDEEIPAMCEALQKGGLQPQRVINLGNLVFKRGNLRTNNGKVNLPKGSTQKSFKNDEEFHTPSPQASRDPKQPQPSSFLDRMPRLFAAFRWRCKLWSQTICCIPNILPALNLSTRVRNQSLRQITSAIFPSPWTLPVTMIWLESAYFA